jgi:hypothetical protein
MLVEDAPIDYWSGGTFDANSHFFGNGLAVTRLLRYRKGSHAKPPYAGETVLLDGVAGDFIKTGVWRGGLPDPRGLPTQGRQFHNAPVTFRAGHLRHHRTRTQQPTLPSATGSPSFPPWRPPL